MKAVITVMESGGKVSTHEVDVTPTAEVQARDRTLAELVRALPHDYICATRHAGYMAGGISFDVNQPPYAHEVKHECNCPRGELLAMLGETA
jgi:hypothetical protein